MANETKPKNLDKNLKSEAVAISTKVVSHKVNAKPSRTACINSLIRTLFGLFLVTLTASLTFALYQIHQHQVLLSHLQQRVTHLQGQCDVTGRDGKITEEVERLLTEVKTSPIACLSVLVYSFCKPF